MLHSWKSITLQNSPIRVGSIDLLDFEIPQSVRFGGRHRLAVHILAGGRRIIERLGPDDSEVQFKGTFSGPSAEARAQMFDDLRMAGEIVWLTWESFRRRIIVKNFIADYHSRWWIPYQASCVVVHQTHIPLQPLGLGTMISLDLTSAAAAFTDPTLSLIPLQTALAAPNVLTTGTSDQAQATAAVSSTLSQANDQIAQQSAVLDTPIALSTEPSSFGQAYASMVSSAGAMAALVNMKAYVGRIGINLTGGLT